MPKLTVYCCAVEATASGVRVRSRGDCSATGPGLERTDGKVLVRLQPERPGLGAATIRMLPRGHTVFCDAGTPSLRFGRAIRSSKTGATEAVLDELALILKHPDHCRWLATTAQATGPEEDDPRRIGPILIPEVPEGDARVRPTLPAANGRSMVRVPGAEAVPGDQLSLVWDFGKGKEVFTLVHAGGWLETPCLLGGRVVAAAGEVGSEDRRYLVQGHGQWTICSASDYVPYTVGDWVYFSRVSTQCTRCQWWETYMTVDVSTMTGGSHTAPEEQPRPVLEEGMRPEAVILPLVCGGFSAQSPVFEPYAPPAVTSTGMGDVLDFCLRRGTVIEVHANGLLAVELPWGRADSLPAHYHCPGAGHTAGGHTAFQPEDEVLVVSSRDREQAHAVIGFANKLPRPCAEFVVISTGIPEHGGRQFYLVWDVLAGAPASTLPDGAGGVLSPDVFPCTVDVIQPWLDQSRTISVEDQMNNLMTAERLGFVDSVRSRSDAHPTPGRQCAELTCTPPEDCPWYNIYVDGEVLGGHCGACSTQDARANPHAGQDVAQHAREATHTFADEEGHLHDYRTWSESHPFLQCVRQSAAPHPATSVRCVWGAFEDVVQVSRAYNAWREVRFATDLSENSLEFSETVTDRISFPGISHRPAFEWTDVSHVQRPVTNEGGGAEAPREWVWNDRTVTVNGFGLRTQRSWLFAYILITRRWKIEPWVNANKVPAPGFDIVVAAGTGSVLTHPLAASPFSLPTDATLESALKDLIQAAFDDASFPASTIHSENAFHWEVRA